MPAPLPTPSLTRSAALTPSPLLPLSSPKPTCPQAVALLADLWLHAQTRDELLRLFVVPPELLRTYPELGKELLDSFAWVDAQLAIG